MAGSSSMRAAPSDDGGARPLVRAFAGAADAREWRYLAEGNAHLVLDYAGADPSLARTVLRLRKLRRGDGVSTAGLAATAGAGAGAGAGITDAQLWAGHPAMRVFDPSSAATSKEERTHAFVAAVLRGRRRHRAASSARACRR
jgi:hypothetical protein